VQRELAFQSVQLFLPVVKFHEHHRIVSDADLLAG
jgi:hypothetical protein